MRAFRTYNTGPERLVGDDRGCPGHDQTPYIVLDSTTLFLFSFPFVHSLHKHGHSKGQQVRLSASSVSPHNSNDRTLSPSSSSSFARRKAFAIKHQEAEPLTRRDLQYDLLHHVFADQERVFSDPSSSSPSSSSSTKEDGRGTAVTFRDLYVHALMDSPRCSKALREKMQDTPDFATDFAKMSLLANVGRVNTTMTCLSFFHFMFFLFSPSVPPHVDPGRPITHSSSGNAYGITYISSRPLVAESRCEPSRRTEDKEYPQSLQPQR